MTIPIREEGFYKVIFDGRNEVAYCSGGESEFWLIIGDSDKWESTHFCEIGPRLDIDVSDPDETE